jgi:glycosyltransferase involved in cell wall biosynthesis
VKNKILSIDARMLFSGGVGTYLQNLLKRMPLQELGLKVKIYYRTDKESAWLKQHQPAAILKHCPHWIYGIKEQLFWLKNIKGGAFWSPHFNIPFWGPEKRLVTIHDGAFHLGSGVPPLLHLYGRVVYWFIRQRADAIITVSEFAKKRITTRAGIAEERIRAINLGVDEEWFAPAKAERPYAFPYFIYVGNIKPHKNLPRLLKAFEKSGVEQKLVCVGAFKNSKFRDEIAKEEIQRLQGKGRVIFTEEIFGEPLQNLVKHADGLLMPSLEESFGLPLLEAMAAGVPVLASNIESVTDLHEGKLLLCDPYKIDDIARELRELAELNGEARGKIVREGREHARQFDWDKTAQATFNVMKKTFVK